MFVAEARSLASLPVIGPPEVAIAGRSNVGKSTLLNRLAGRRALARTSKTPGRTRGIVFYDLALAAGAARAVRLADLPGYGYARVSQAERASWQPLLEGYAERRPTLALFIVLIDGRRGIEAEDRQLVDWLGTLSVPARLVFTKVDKLTAAERARASAAARATFAGAAALGQPLFASGQTGEGVPDVWAAILATLARQAAALAPRAEVATGEKPA